MPTAADMAMAAQMQGIAEGLDEGLAAIYGARIGFVLVVAPFNQPTTEVQYVSNLERSVGVDLISELQKRWATGQPDIPTNERN